MRFCVCSFFLMWRLSACAQELIAYYNGHAADPDRYPLEKLTHIIYSFGHLTGDRMTFSRADSQAIRRLVHEKRRYRNLKIMLSLGGWEGCSTCARVFATVDGRNHFAHSVNDLLDYFNADGIDIDWEFPTQSDDLTALIRTLHDSLAPGKELSFIAAAFSPYLQNAYDWRRLVPLVTRVNLMTYDLIGSRSPITGHHAALYSSGPQIESADHALRYLDSLGISASRIAIGAAFYAREFVDVPDIDHGLFQHGRFRRFLTIGRMRRLTGFTTHWDSTAQAAYRYNPVKQVFLSFDDARSLTAKARYVRQRHLNGIFFWELSLDRPREGYLDLLYQALHVTP